MLRGSVGVGGGTGRRKGNVLSPSMVLCFLEWFVSEVLMYEYIKLSYHITSYQGQNGCGHGWKRQILRPMFAR